MAGWNTIYYDILIIWYSRLLFGPPLIFLA